MARRAFTLLEVVIALIILSTFAVACLQLRVNSLRAAKQIEQSQRVQRAIDDVLELAMHRMLPNPEVERDSDDEVKRITWRGEHLGIAYECVSETVVVPAPQLAQAGAKDGDQKDADVVNSVEVQRYVVTMLGEQGEVLTPSRRRR